MCTWNWRQTAQVVKPGLTKKAEAGLTKKAKVGNQTVLLAFSNYVAVVQAIRSGLSSSSSSCPSCSPSSCPSCCPSSSLSSCPCSALPTVSTTAPLSTTKHPSRTLTTKKTTLPDHLFTSRFRTFFDLLLDFFLRGESLSLLLLLLSLSLIGGVVGGGTPLAASFALSSLMSGSCTTF